MKKLNKILLFPLLIVLFFALPSFAQNKKEIKIKLRNNSFWFKKVALISYVPEETGNGTRIFTLLPGASSKQKFPIGTRIYIANDIQVGIVMSGDRLESQPFLIVKAEDEGKVFRLHQ